MNKQQLSENPNKLPEEQRLAPIVFLITEEDGAAFEWIIRNNNMLRELGYKHINLEQNSDESIDSLSNKLALVENYRQTILLKPEKKALDEETNRWYGALKNYHFLLGMDNLLKNLANEWTISFIDIASTEMFKQPGQSSELIAPLEALKPKREKNFARNS